MKGEIAFCQNNTLFMQDGLRAKPYTKIPLYIGNWGLFHTYSKWVELWAPTHYWLLGPLRGNLPKICWRFTNGILLKDTAQIPSHTVPSESFFPWRSFEDYVRCWGCKFVFFGKGQLCTLPGSLTAKAPEKLPSTQIGKANVFQSHPFFRGQLAGKNFGAGVILGGSKPWVGKWGLTWICFF